MAAQHATLCGYFMDPDVSRKIAVKLGMDPNINNRADVRSFISKYAQKKDARIPDLEATREHPHSKALKGFFPTTLNMTFGGAPYFVGIAVQTETSCNLAMSSGARHVSKSPRSLGGNRTAMTIDSSNAAIYIRRSKAFQAKFPGKTIDVVCYGRSKTNGKRLHAYMFETRFGLGPRDIKFNEGPEDEELKEQFMDLCGIEEADIKWNTFPFC